MSEESFPQTLREAVVYFSNEDLCVEFIAMLRWPNGATCVHCGKSDTVNYLPKYRRWHCKDCRKQFSVKHGSIFEESPIPLNKWVVGVWLIAACKNGISSYEIHRALGITQKSAWHMMHRIRMAMTQGTLEKMGGEGETVEADETYIGGLARNMHKDVRARKIQGRTGYAGKTAVFGLLERGKDGKSKVRARVMPDVWSQPEARKIIRESVEPGTSVYTDEHGAYHALGTEGFNHEFVRHAEFYVKGAVHTNGIENFWSLPEAGNQGHVCFG